MFGVLEVSLNLSVCRTVWYSAVGREVESVIEWELLPVAVTEVPAVLTDSDSDAPSCGLVSVI